MGEASGKVVTLQPPQPCFCDSRSCDPPCCTRASQQSGHPASSSCSTRWGYQGKATGHWLRPLSASTAALAIAMGTTALLRIACHLCSAVIASPMAKGWVNGTSRATDVHTAATAVHVAMVSLPCTSLLHRKCASKCLSHFRAACWGGGHSRLPGILRVTPPPAREAPQLVERHHGW